MTLARLVHRMFASRPHGRTRSRRRGGPLTFMLMVAIALFELLRGARRRNGRQL